MEHLNQELWNSGTLELWNPHATRSVVCLSVGNLAFGGRGKTPTVAALARHLRRRDERPAILTRGYSRRVEEDGVVIVSDGTHVLADLDRSGDEPMMLARELSGVAVLVCDQRAVAGALARYALGATVLILDDGFQHRQMARDVDLVIVTPSDLRDRRVPFGRLRESVSALERADAVLLDTSGPEPIDAGEAGLAPTSPPGPLDPGLRTLLDSMGLAVFTLRRHTGAPVPLEDGPRPGSVPAPQLSPEVPIFALAGIAHPARFTRALAGAGWAIAGSWAPGDHYAYGPRDVERLARDVARTGAAAVVTTAKDAARLRPLRPLPVPVYVLPLEVTIEPEAEFGAWLDGRLTHARTGAVLAGIKTGTKTGIKK